MRINILADKMPWFGKHQCYERVADYIKQINQDTQIYCTRDTIINKIFGKLYSIKKGWHSRHDFARAAAEFKFSVETSKNAEISHILFFDLHYYYLHKWKKAPKNIIGTIHHPVNRVIGPPYKKYLQRLSSAIILYRRGVPRFEKIIGRERVKYIPYGVDTDFFYQSKEPNNRKDIIFTGINGRNIEMLFRVIKKLGKTNQELKFHLVVPKKYRYPLKKLANLQNIIWHDNLLEEELRDLYQNSSLMLLPMNQSGVNTAVVEAMACGLPVVTTDVGGIRDYGGGSIYPVVKNNDDDAMVELVEKYLADEKYRNSIAKKERQFAEDKLAWPIVAKRHLKVYEGLMK